MGPAGWNWTSVPVVWFAAWCWFVVGNWTTVSNQSVKSQSSSTSIWSLFVGLEQLVEVCLLKQPLWRDVRLFAVSCWPQDSLPVKAKRGMVQVSPEQTLIHSESPSAETKHCYFVLLLYMLITCKTCQTLKCLSFSFSSYLCSTCVAKFHPNTVHLFNS